jgi:hypothetical protein
VYRHYEPYYNAALSDEAWDAICRAFIDGVRELSGLSDPEQRWVFRIPKNMRKRVDRKILEAHNIQNHHP